MLGGGGGGGDSERKEKGTKASTGMGVHCASGARFGRWGGEDAKTVS